MIETEVEETTETSKKRELVATATAAGVGIVLNIAAGVLITKLSKKIHDKIAPETETE